MKQLIWASCLIAIGASTVMAGPVVQYYSRGDATNTAILKKDAFQKNDDFAFEPRRGGDHLRGLGMVS